MISPGRLADDNIPALKVRVCYEILADGSRGRGRLSQRCTDHKRKAWLRLAGNSNIIT